MELQFHKTVCQCLQQAKYEVKEQEQTQEVRLPDAMPDIGRVLGAWGQVILRSKEWRSGQMMVSGGVMAWVLYLPEDGGPAQSIETWLPFQMKWELMDIEREGMLLAKCLLRSIDARSVSARKLMVRSVVSVLAQALLQEQTTLYTPQKQQENVQILQNTYPVLLPKEAGEKPFAIEEELTLPGTCPKPEKLIRYALQPELIDKKILGGRIVFRGMALLHILYQAEDAQLYCWDLEVPFSQFSELDQSYEQEAIARICAMVTSMELDMDPEGKLHLKAGVTCQYVVYDRCMIELAEDAYSNGRSVEFKQEMLQLPAVLDMKEQSLRAEQTVEGTGLRVADTAFYPNHPRLVQSDDGMQLALSGRFQLLYYDENGSLQFASPGWERALALAAGEDCGICADVTATGKTQGGFGVAQLTAGVMVNTVCSTQQGMPMITALTLGEEEKKDEERPSLILRKKGSDSLWELAKSCGSTVEAIKQTNRLTQEPEEEQMLLIPVC